LAQGLSLLSRLSSHAADPAADAATFRQVGTDTSQKSLLAVVGKGMSRDATAEDWANMHRAYDALVELYVGEQQLLKAGIFAGLQDSAYGHNEGDYQAALVAARQALDLEQRSGLTQTISIPWVNLGNDLIHLGRIDEGADALYKAREFLQDPTSSLAADIWTRIVALESSRGNSAAAHRESEAFLQNAGSNTPAAFRADALLAAANLDIDDQRYDQAIARVHQALALLKGAKDAETVGYRALNVLMTIGLKAMENMPVDQALSLCSRLDKDFPGLPISVSGFSHEVANHRRRLSGQFDLVLHDDAEQLESARTANDVQGQVSVLLSTAVDYSYLRDSSQQLAALQQAVDLLHSPQGERVVPQLRFRILEALGYTQLARGDLRAARAAFTQVLTGIEAVSSAQIRAELATLYAEAKLGMASLLERDGDIKGARDILDQALNPPAGFPGRFNLSTVLLQRAKLEQAAKKGQAPRPRRNEPDDVAKLYLEAIDTLHQEKDANNEVYARLELVHYLATTGGTPKPSADSAGTPGDAWANALARQQLALARSAAGSVGLADASWRVQFLQGILDQNAGDRAAAVRSYSGAVSALDRIRSGLSEEEERRSFIDSASVQELYQRLVELLTASGDREQAWEFLERDKARSFLESLRGRHFAGTASEAADSAGAAARPGRLAQLEQQILTLRLSLSPENESTLRGSGQSTEALNTKLLALENEFALARQESSLTASRATQPMALAPLTLSSARRLLPPRTALIEYAILEKELAAFIVTRESAKELHWPADTGAMPDMLLALRARLSSPPQPGDKLDARLASVSDLLLGPIIAALAPDVNRLVIVPTQSLAVIPFGALPVPTHGQGSARLMIDRYSIAYLPSASTLQFLRFGPPSASPDLFLGAIGDVAVENLPALPGTLAETAAIQKLYPRSTRLTGAAFTHEAAVNALTQHQEVHFATHGLFEEQAPLFSSLVTAPAVGQPSRLSLYELTDLHLKARLVILSACETDRGKMTGGDEAAGLTRTFLQAGAETVVSSLWKVNDESTALLMESLHAHLRAGELTPDALRHSELEVRRKFPQPYYWAAFVDTGVR